MAAVILILFGVLFFSLLTCVFCFIRTRYKNRLAFTGGRDQCSFSKEQAKIRMYQWLKTRPRMTLDYTSVIGIPTLA
uniref:Uncharacterized protein n=1 Tax=Magallana gigas TaxID=29159 RepID=K1QYS8_MAGGI